MYIQNQKLKELELQSKVIYERFLTEVQKERKTVAESSYLIVPFRQIFKPHYEPLNRRIADTLKFPRILRLFGKLLELDLNDNSPQEDFRDAYSIIASPDGQNLAKPANGLNLSPEFIINLNIVFSTKNPPFISILLIVTELELLLSQKCSECQRSIKKILSRNHTVDNYDDDLHLILYDSLKLLEYEKHLKTYNTEEFLVIYKDMVDLYSRGPNDEQQSYLHIVQLLLNLQNNLPFSLDPEIIPRLSGSEYNIDLLNPIFEKILIYLSGQISYYKQEILKSPTRTVKHRNALRNYDTVSVLDLGFDNVISKLHLEFYLSFRSYLEDSAAVLDFYSDLFIFQYKTFQTDQALELELIELARRIDGLTEILDDNSKLKAVEYSLQNGYIAQDIFDAIADDIRSFLLIQWEDFASQEIKKYIKRKKVMNPRDKGIYNAIILYQKSPSEDTAQNIISVLYTLGYPQDTLEEIRQKISNHIIKKKLFQPVLQQMQLPIISWKKMKKKKN